LKNVRESHRFAGLNSPRESALVHFRSEIPALHAASILSGSTCTTLGRSEGGEPSGVRRRPLVAMIVDVVVVGSVRLWAARQTHSSPASATPELTPTCRRPNPFNWIGGISYRPVARG